MSLSAQVEKYNDYQHTLLNSNVQCNEVVACVLNSNDLNIYYNPHEAYVPLIVLNDVGVHLLFDIYMPIKYFDHRALCLNATHVINIYLLFGRAISSYNIYSANIMSDILERSNITAETVTESLTVSKQFAVNTHNNTTLLTEINIDFSLHMIGLTYLYIPCTVYNYPLTRISFKTPFQIKSDVYAIPRIDKELLRKFMHIGKYFSEVRGMLKLDEKTGFYTYEVDGVRVPIICLHEYMSYEGVSPVDIAVKCYKDGKCKYCHADMLAYHESIDDLLPTQLYDLMYRFIDCIKVHVNENAILNILFSFIVQQMKSTDNKEFLTMDSRKAAFCAVLLYNIYTLSKNDIPYVNTRVVDLVDLMKKYWSQHGFDMKAVEGFVNSSPEYTKELNNVILAIKGRIFAPTDDVFTMHPLSVLFGKIVNATLPDVIQSLKNSAKTPAQKLWTDPTKMYEFNCALRDAALALWMFPRLVQTIKELNHIPIDTRLTRIIFTASSWGKRFFEMMFENYCPVNGYHEWNAKVCKHCGLNQNGKNIDDIYEKYAKTINGVFLQRPAMIDGKMFKIDIAHHIADILETDAKKLWTTMFTSDDGVDEGVKQLIMDNTENATALNEVLQLFSVILSVPTEELAKITNGEGLKKLFMYALTRNIVNTKDLIFQLLTTYIQSVNVTALFTGSDSRTRFAVSRLIKPGELESWTLDDPRFCFRNVKCWNEVFNDKMLTEMAEEMAFNGGMLQREMSIEDDW